MTTVTRYIEFFTQMTREIYLPRGIAPAMPTTRLTIWIFTTPEQGEVVYTISAAKDIYVSDYLFAVPGGTFTVRVTDGNGNLVCTAQASIAGTTHWAVGFWNDYHRGQNGDHLSFCV